MATNNPMMRKSLKVGLANAQNEYQSSNTVVARMTLEGVSSKVLGLLALLVASASVAWFAPVQMSMILLLVGMIGGLICGIAAAFSKSSGKGFVIGYSLFEGLLVGALSKIFEASYPGVVVSAVIATLTTAGAMFIAYRAGWVKVTSKFRKVMTFALLGYLGFALINIIVSLFTANAGVYSSPLGWVFALVGAGLAAFTLNLDFDTVEQGVTQGWPKEMEWRASFGLVSTLVWLYVEMLRLFSYFRN